MITSGGSSCDVGGLELLHSGSYKSNLVGLDVYCNVNVAIGSVDCVQRRWSKIE